MLKSAQPTLSPEERRQMRLSEVLAQVAAGKVGFMAQIIASGGNAECCQIGHQADAELLSRDKIIRQKNNEIEKLRAENERLKGAK